jgi:hypothetical protein
MRPVSDKVEDPERDPTLNPALKSRVETTYDTSESSRAPADTASVQREEGRAWPIIWMAVAIIGVLILIYLII